MGPLFTWQLSGNYFMKDWISLLLILSLVLQVLLVTIFSLQVKRRRAQRIFWDKTPILKWPPVEVILCLRGADESLLPMLKAISRQDYLGDWRLQIVVDSPDDPSKMIVETFLASHRLSGSVRPTWKDLKLQILAGRPLRGSLKCAALLQAFENLNDETVVVAFIDADAIVKPDWLSQLVQACLQPGIGAVSGNRWFVPERDTLLGWTRAVWNAGALVMMTILAIPWGGSLAVRREVIDAGSWKTLLEYSFCEDTGLLRPLRELGLRYVFRPELLIVDHQDGISLQALSGWVSRQLLTARLHHPAWPLVALHGMGTTALLFAGLFNGAWLALATYEIGCFVLLLWIESIAMQRSPRSLMGWARALFIGQIVDGWATLNAFLLRKVEWREVIYQVTDWPRGVAPLESPKLFDVRSPSNSSGSFRSD